jgi:putative transcriptional regulator
MNICKLFLLIADHIDLQEVFLIKCHLSRMLGERKLKIADLSRDTGINRGTATRLYHESAERVDMEVINSLCQYFNCTVSDIFEYIPDATKTEN